MGLLAPNLGFRAKVLDREIHINRENSTLFVQQNLEVSSNDDTNWHQRLWPDWAPGI